MSAEPALIDTNVLVYALFAQRPEHAASLALLESAQEPAANLVVAPQNLAEFYAVVTNPRRVSTPLSGAAARAEVEKFMLLAGLRVLDVPSDVVGRWQALLGRYPGASALDGRVETVEEGTPVLQSLGREDQRNGVAHRRRAADVGIERARVR